MDGGGLLSLTDSSHLWKDQTMATTNTKSMDAISILVVDDDITCLAIVAAILKKFNYEVVTVKHPKDALCTLRIKGFDLVVSDVHMPDMNGFELQQAIAQEFNLPVVLMSADDKEGIALKGLEGGAAFFIMKPVNPDDFRDLWQFSAMKRKKNQYVEIQEISDENPSSENVASDQVGAPASSSSLNNEEATNSKEPKRKSPIKEGSEERNIGESSSQQKKPKIVWTNSLHNRFLEAIRNIGLERAVPKKILEVMNVSGLTRENVASHLQKYRIFLRRVSDASYKIQYSSQNSESSRIISSPSTLMFNKFSRHAYLNRAQFGAPFPNDLEASSSRSSVFGQSSLLSNRGIWQQPSIGSATLTAINQSDRTRVTQVHNNYAARASIHGHLANITLEEQQSTPPNAGTTSVVPTSSSLPLIRDPTTYRTNYVGYSLSDIKNFTEKYVGSSSWRGIMTSLPRDDQLQSNNTTTTAVVPSGSALGQNVVGASSSYGADDGRRECIYSMPTESLDAFGDGGIMQFGFENGLEIEESAFSPIFDLSEFDLLSAQQALEITLPNQNQSQQNDGGEANINPNNKNSNFYGEMVDWHNYVNVPYSFDQVPNQLQGNQQQLSDSQGFASSPQLNGGVLLPTNEHQGLNNSMEFGTFAPQLNGTVLSPTLERNDDDFLESLLAPFGEDHIP